MAAPHVAGAIAIYLSSETLSPSEVVSSVVVHLLDNAVEGLTDRLGTPDKILHLSESCEIDTETETYPVSVEITVQGISQAGFRDLINNSSISGNLKSQFAELINDYCRESQSNYDDCCATTINTRYYSSSHSDNFTQADYISFEMSSSDSSSSDSASLYMPVQYEANNSLCSNLNPTSALSAAAVSRQSYLDTDTAKDILSSCSNGCTNLLEAGTGISGLTISRTTVPTTTTTTTTTTASSASGGGDDVEDIFRDSNPLTSLTQDETNFILIVGVALAAVVVVAILVAIAVVLLRNNSSRHRRRRGRNNEVHPATTIAYPVQQRTGKKDRAARQPPTIARDQLQVGGGEPVSFQNSALASVSAEQLYAGYRRDSKLVNSYNEDIVNTHAADASVR